MRGHYGHLASYATPSRDSDPSEFCDALSHIATAMKRMRGKDEPDSRFPGAGWDENPTEPRSAGSHP